MICVFCKIDVTLDCQDIKRVLRISNLIIENVLDRIYEKANSSPDFRNRNLLGYESDYYVTW